MQWIELPLGELRRATGISLAVFVVGSLAVAVLGLWALAAFPSLGAPVWTRDSIFLAPLGTVLRLGLTVGVLILWLGKLRLEDVGLAWSRIPAGLALGGLIWAGAQGLSLGLDLFERGGVALHSDWQDQGAAARLGRLASQLLAVSVLEETVFRGYLMPQLYLALAARWPDHRSRALTLGIVLSQGLFTFLHVPFILYAGASAQQLGILVVVVFLFGLFFCVAYLRTANLFLAMAIHALVTAPTPLFAWRGTAPGPIIIATLALLGLWEYRPWGRAPKLR